MPQECRLEPASWQAKFLSHWMAFPAKLPTLCNPVEVYSRTNTMTVDPLLLG